MKLNVRNINGGPAGEIDVRNDVFGVPENPALLHQVMVAHLANKRQGTVKTKTRSEVSGGGAKPRPQKHTGRARAGSIRSPIWVGGGRAFGPSPRNYKQRTPKKMRRLAIVSVLSDKARQGSLVILDNLDLTDSKTRSIKSMLKALEINNSTLIVTDGPNANVIRAARNLKKVKTLPAQVLNTIDLLNKSHLVITTEAVKKVEENWGGVYKGGVVDSEIDSNLPQAMPSDLATAKEEVVSLSDEQLISALVLQIDTPDSSSETVREGDMGDQLDEVPEE
ncbi:MAG: 50S ribosomal protein L4 [SAR202 cluster bacterium Ae2-Chloro-G2]|nr:MAG: 50S ribosomal protein L4 [SAR202 cluster bacterium Ae2-Chloro-G2]